MSLAKDNIDKVDEYQTISKEILKEIGAIKYCPCGATYWATEKYQRGIIFGVAVGILKNKYGSEYDYILFDQSIDKVLEETQSEFDCPICNIH